MKSFLVASLLLFGFSANVHSGDGKDSTKSGSKKPWIHIVKYKENVVEFHHKKPHKGLGLNNFFFPRRVLGEYELQPDGIQFTPFTQTPDGMPQKQFEQYWNDDFTMDQIFIPYATMKKVSLFYGVKIKTLNGKKVTFSTNHARKMVKEIQSSLDAQE